MSPYREEQDGDRTIVAVHWRDRDGARRSAEALMRASEIRHVGTDAMLRRVASFLRVVADQIEREVSDGIG